MQILQLTELLELNVPDIGQQLEVKTYSNTNIKVFILIQIKNNNIYKKSHSKIIL